MAVAKSLLGFRLLLPLILATVVVTGILWLQRPLRLARSTSVDFNTAHPAPPAAVLVDHTEPDAATFQRLPSPTTPTGHQARARLLQSLFCEHFYPPPAFSSSSPSSSFAATALVPLKTAGFHPTRGRRPRIVPAGIYVYAADDADIVSGWVATDGTWEPEITASIVEALAESEGLHLSDPLFVDVGSNVGVHSVVAAAWGFRVVSFDALRENAGQFRATLCTTPALMERVTFINNGLGAKSATCAIASDDSNQGDGTVTCSARHIAKYKASTAARGRGSVRGNSLKPFRQWLHIDPLDTFLAEDVWVMKMDVEGFELDVLRGATALFAARRVFFLVTEVMGGLAKTAEMLVELRRLGFSCSLDGWYGKRWPLPETRDGVRIEERFDAWCLHPKSLREVGLGAKADAALANV
ncbi:S-adenosyl-L-methionine-dependent methyltransferase [Zopfochytrium polystomum]|nr:S-adenosyl-L-methionine-dependent methyltransferase [Zopfochytrium polystomum]